MTVRAVPLSMVVLSALSLSGCVTAPPKPVASAGQNGAIQNLSVQNLTVANQSIAAQTVTNQTVQSQTVTPAPGTVRTLGVGPGPVPGPGPNYQVVRYIGVDATSWGTLPVPLNYSDLYTRIVVSSADPVGDAAPGKILRNYRGEKRGWLDRVLSRETRTVTTVASITMRDPGLAFTIPLFSSTQASGSKIGNTWNTLYTSSSVESPLFRIGPNTGMTLHLSAKVSKDVKSEGVSLALKAVTTAVRIAAPASTLVTSLSKPDVNNAATAIDSAISSLLSVDISEDLEVGRLVDSWTRESHIELFGCAPFIRTEAGSTDPDTRCAQDVDLDGAKNIAIGKWEISFACPRMSVFDPRDICHPLGQAARANDVVDLTDPSKRQAANKEIADSVSDAQVLSFNLSSQVTVGAFVQAQPWFTAFTSKATKAASDYDSFCAGALVGLQASGFNLLDSAIVLRTMIRQLPQFASLTEFTAAGMGRNCLVQMNRLGVDYP